MFIMSSFFLQTVKSNNFLSQNAGNAISDTLEFQTFLSALAQSDPCFGVVPGTRIALPRLPELMMNFTKHISIIDQSDIFTS